MPLQTDLNQNLRNEILTNKNKFQGASTDFSINLFQYPEDLGGEDLKHFVQFNINVRGKSKLKLGSETRISQVSRDDSAQLSESDLAQAKAASLTGGGALAGLAGGKVVSNFFSKSNAKQKKTGAGIKSAVAGAKGAIVGGGVGAALNFTEMLESDKSYRISDVIALHVNEPPTVRYNAQYSNKDLGTLAGLVGGVSGVSSIANQETAAAVGLLFAKLPSVAGLGSPVDVVGASAKVALNPFKEVLFESIDFRSFSFKYKFLPKSEKEAQNIDEIIKRFKFHMHPELSTNKLFFIYPSEFEIAYYFENAENRYFHKFKPSVLESLEVTYGGDTFSSFRKGNPTEINVSMTFRETEILTKQQIANGY